MKTVLIVVVVLAIGAFGYYAISPIFRNVKVDEAVPGQTAMQKSDSIEPEGAMMKKDEVIKPEGAMMAKSDDVEKGAAMMKAESSGAMMEASGEGAMMKYDTEPVQVVGTAGHPASGTARVVSADGKNYVRYENFKTLNGPDIYVYLSKDKDARDFVNLGVVKATEGNINYEIPAGVNPDEYPYVLTWCKAFGVLFNYAQLR